MENKIEKTYWVKIYLSGSIETIKAVCREYCYRIGLCVTINPTLFIYTGGEEYGVEIGLINYPRFPDSEKGIMAKAVDLADRCRAASFQHSYLIMSPTETIWDSIKVTDDKKESL